MFRKTCLCYPEQHGSLSVSPFVKRLQKEAMDLAKETKVFIHQRSLQNKLNYQAPKQLTQVIEENASLTQCLMILIALVHVRLPNSMYLKTADLSLPQPLLNDLEHSLNNIKKVDDVWWLVHNIWANKW